MAAGASESHCSRRRDFLRTGALVAGGAWVAPVVIATPVAAAVGSGVGFYQYCFDDGTSEGWTLTGLWNINNGRSTSPDSSLHYGTGVGGDYDTGAANSGTATSPPFTVPTTGSTELTFQIWREVESYGSGDWDELSLSVIPGGTVLYVRSRDGGTGGAFESVSIDLSAFAGSTIQLVFAFDTGDGNFNNFEGVYIDDIRVPGGTPPGGGGAVSLSAERSLSGPEQVLADRPKPTKRAIDRRTRQARAERFAAGGTVGDGGVQAGIQSGG